MAAQQSQQRQPAAAQCAESLDRLKGVSGARRLKTAVTSEQRAQEIPVATDKKDQDAAHCFVNSCQCHSRLERSSRLLAPEAAALACTTMSAAGSSTHRIWKLARIWRLMRLRATAPVTAVRATLIPRRADCRLGRAYTRKQASLLHCPCLKTRLNSAGVRRRTLGGKPAFAGATGRGLPGPLHGGHSTLGGRVWWPCARGIHACVCGAACWADRFFSCCSSGWMLPSGGAQAKARY